jgi:hypothetical protein
MGIGSARRSPRGRGTILPPEELTLAVTDLRSGRL